MKRINVLFGTGTALTHVYQLWQHFYSMSEVSQGVQTSTEPPQVSTVNDPLLGEEHPGGEGGVFSVPPQSCVCKQMESQQRDASTQRTQ